MQLPAVAKYFPVSTELAPCVQVIPHGAEIAIAIAKQRTTCGITLYRSTTCSDPMRSPDDSRSCIDRKRATHALESTHTWNMSCPSQLSDPCNEAMHRG